MRRRDFLATTLALPAFARALPRVAPQFGCASITWDGNDRAAIDDISALGFRGIQLRTAAVKTWGARPDELRELLASRHLAFVALSSGNLSLDRAAEEKERAIHLRNAQFVRDAGGTFLQIIDERPDGRAPTADDFKRMGGLLTDLGKRVADIGVTLAYHNHMGALGQAPNEVEQVLQASDAKYVRLLLDVAHYQAAGGDPVEAARNHAARLAFLHLKDLERAAPGGTARSYRFVELGRGQVNIRGVLAELDRAGFGGWAIVELDRVTDPSLTPKACAERSKEHLASLGFTL